MIIVIIANCNNSLLETSLHDFWKGAYNAQFPTAIWRLPNTTNVHFLANFVEKPRRVTVDVNELPSGFALSPFSNENGKGTYFLDADLHLSFTENNQIQWFSKPLDEHPSYQKLLEKSKENVVFCEKNIHQSAPFLSKADFMALVEKAVAEIKNGTFKKVVLSRSKLLQLPDNFDCITFFQQLCAAYSTAFVSLVSLPHLDEIWMCASPETLVSQNSEGFFKTMALAGTQSAISADGTPILPINALWRQKEIEEQALVSRYIINCFKKVRVREYEEDGPKTVQAANLLHLRSDFVVDTKSIHFPEMVSVMLDLLHPTSAVCGMPKQEATDFIKNNEPQLRTFYSGYLGPVNVQNETHLFVNLRTLLLKNQEVRLFAGCGITADSNPEKEWFETEMKCQTLAQLLV